MYNVLYTHTHVYIELKSWLYLTPVQEVPALTLSNHWNTEELWPTSSYWFMLKIVLPCEIKMCFNRAVIKFCVTEVEHVLVFTPNTNLLLCEWIVSTTSKFTHNIKDYQAYAAVTGLVGYTSWEHDNVSLGVLSACGNNRSLADILCVLTW